MRNLLLIPLLLAPASAIAAPAPIVVTGMGLPGALGDSAYDLQVIDRQRLASTASGRLEDVLRDAAGFHQFRRSDSRSAHPTSQGASLRGLGGNASARALVLLDGVPVADPFGGWIDWPMLVPDRLGYVRVTRGGGAGPFGSGALAGTIELGSASRDQLPGLSAGIAYGSRDSVIADGGVAADLGGGFVTLSGRYDRGDGFIPIIADDRGPIDQPAFYRQWSSRLRAVVPVGDDTELQVSGALFGDRRSRGTPFTINDTLGQDMSVRLVGRGRWAWEALGYLQLRQFSSQYASIPATRDGFTPALDQYNTPATGFGGKLEIRPPLGRRAELRLGVDYREVVGRTKERYNYAAASDSFLRLRQAGGRNRTIGGFAEASYQPVRSITLTAGGRIDRWQILNGFLREQLAATGVATSDQHFASRDHVEPTGRVGIAYRPADAVTLRAAAYSGYRLPTLNELYRPYRAGADITAANSALKPERLKGVEAGVEFRPLSNAHAGATIFWNRLHNAIANVTVGPTVNDRQRQNLNAIRSRGVEVDAGLNYGFWDFTLSYALADARVHGSGLSAPLDGLRPAQTARHQASATLSWLRGADLGASLTARYMSGQFEDDLNQRRLDDAFTLDASVHAPLRTGLIAEARVENLTDTRVEATISSSDVVERATPRTFWIALRYVLP